MDIFTVSLFGHREIEDLRLPDASLSAVIKELLQTTPYISFLIGRNGEFDEYAASVIKSTRKILNANNCDLTLVLPYPVANVEYYEKYYDSIIIPESAQVAHPKSAITLKNRWMIEHSDLVIVYVERKFGGAYQAMKYAQFLCKPIINIFAN